MQKNVLGYPRIGGKRELKKASEKYWSGKISIDELLNTAKTIRSTNWKIQKDAGIDLISSNDFSYYDQVLDLSLMLGAIPPRYQKIKDKDNVHLLDLYYAMARGVQKDDLDITAMEMTKWFDTNYHYIVPELFKDQKFSLFSTKIIDEFLEAKAQGIITKPVLISAVSYLLLAKEKEAFDKLDLLDNVLAVYTEIIQKLVDHGMTTIQIDEPFMVMDLDQGSKDAIVKFYKHIRQAFPQLKIMLATYFEGINDNTDLALSLPIDILHVDLVRSPGQLDAILEKIPSTMSLSLGLVDGRNIWKNEYSSSLEVIRKVVDKIGEDRTCIATSCSLLHSPCDLDHETKLDENIKQWLAFAKQKVNELADLDQIISDPAKGSQILSDNQKVFEAKRTSTLINNQAVSQRVNNIVDADAHRKSKFATRKTAQQQALGLPLFPTTTIGSFPQTKEVRKWRSAFKKGKINQDQYDKLLKEETQKAIQWQSEIGIDVLVHGEFERNDMVEYFGEKLQGFAFTSNGWVQSYGSRCVKPPIIYGDVSRPNAMTVDWSSYAQSLTDKLVKGMLTGPVTILQWSFVRNDQPRSVTCNQIALAIRDEVVDLEKAGIKIIQIDEPAIREGLPLRRNDWDEYLQWAVKAFRISASGVEDQTQIHTHMCYSEFNDIIQHIADMDADVITIECSRSQMDLLDAFAKFEYPNEIGPGVYDIHSPRVPAKDEMIHLLQKAKDVIPKEQIWVNPDCGLKTRHWDETKKALSIMVEAAIDARNSF